MVIASTMADTSSARTGWAEYQKLPCLLEASYLFGNRSIRCGNARAGENRQWLAPQSAPHQLSLHPA